MIFSTCNDFQIRFNNECTAFVEYKEVDNNKQMFIASWMIRDKECTINGKPDADWMSIEDVAAFIKQVSEWKYRADTDMIF